MLTMPILMLFYKDMGFSDRESFQLKAFYSIAIVIFEIPSGYVADVIGRRKTLIFGSILGTLGFLVYATTSGYYWFLLAEVTLGIGQSFVSGADSAIMYDSLKSVGREKEYVKYEGRNFTVGNYSEALAGIIGGSLAAIHIRYPFIFQTGIAFMAVPASIMLIEPIRSGIRKKPGIKDIWSIVWYATIKNAKLRYNLLYSSILGTATLTMAWMYQLYLNDIGFSEYAIGATHTVLNLIVGTTTLFAYKIEARLKPQMTIWLTSIIITGSYILSGFMESAWILIILGIFYFSRGIATPVLKDYINRITADDMRATVLSIRSLIIRAFFAIIAPVVGFLSDTYDRSFSLKVIGIVFTILVGSSIFLFLRSLESEKPT
ncbi:multidrug resistance protein [Saccharicrinis fermentans DSM 9555 = JCM 21142]|uniref:Multidrug resistance protein n=2 Tax=Saccharicrinis fermentans TaxID=982 RepID=W7YM62_9BACT|nr:multidrug resistance protein [Saccharicrinis fermentans DSM 9555 = JCM 21142]